MCLASSCFRCCGRKLAGEGGWGGHSPALQPGATSRPLGARSPGSPSLRWLQAPGDRAELGTQAAAAPHPLPLSCVLRRGGWGAWPRPAVVSAGLQLPQLVPEATERAISPEESQTGQNVCTAGCLSPLCPGLVPLPRATSERSFSTSELAGLSVWGLIMGTVSIISGIEGPQ